MLRIIVLKTCSSRGNKKRYNTPTFAVKSSITAEIKPVIIPAIKTVNIVFSLNCPSNPFRPMNSNKSAGIIPRNKLADGNIFILNPGEMGNNILKVIDTRTAKLNEIEFMLKTPVIVLNVKTYAEATGEKALEIANLMNRISKETGTSMAIAVQATDIVMCTKKVDIPVFAQHIDPIKPGSSTGWTLPEAVKAAGAVGTLINHSEHRITLTDVDTCIKRSKEIGLDHIVCSNDVPTSKSIAAFSPNFIAVEPPELIGGDISVTTANPHIVSGTVDAVKNINKKIGVLCGAGVKNGKDVAMAIELGADGVLLASGVVKAKNRESVIRDLASGL